MDMRKGICTVPNLLVVGSHKHYNLEQYVVDALGDLGCNVNFLGYRQFFDNKLFNIIRMAMTRSYVFRNSAAWALFLRRFNEKLIDMVSDNSYDIILSLKGESVLPSTLEKISSTTNTKLALWFPDDPRFFESLVRYIAPHYDQVFTSSTEPRMIDRYRHLNESIASLPFACDCRVHKRITSNKNFDVCFVGSYTPHRAKIIRYLRKNGIDIAIFGPNWNKLVKGDHVFDAKAGPEMTRIFNESRICLNIHDPESALYSTNMRDFEVAGSGGVLLTDPAYDLDRFFDVGKEIIIYKNIDDLLAKIRYHLKHEDKLVEMGGCAEYKTHSEHTYVKRMQSMLDIVGLRK